mgnify:CR=1 FL=1
MSGVHLGKIFQRRMLLMETKKLNHLLKTLEITLHSLHEEVREHNKEYFSDDGQEYPVPIVEEVKEVNNAN